MNSSDKKEHISPSLPREELDAAYGKQQAYFEALQIHPEAVETITKDGHVVTFINFNKLDIEGLEGCVASVYNEKTGEYDTQYSSKQLVSHDDYLRAQQTAIKEHLVNMKDSYAVAVYRGLELYMQQGKKAERLQHSMHVKIMSTAT